MSDDSSDNYFDLNSSILHYRWKENETNFFLKSLSELCCAKDAERNLILSLIKLMFEMIIKGNDANKMCKHVI